MNPRNYCILLFCIYGLASATDIVYNLLEEQPPRTFVGNVADDTNLRSTLNESDFNRLQFEILKEGSKYADWFTIDIKRGQLETSEVIDRENVCTSPQSCILGLDIAIYQEDKVNSLILDLYQAFRIQIILDDLNDNEPSFPKSELSLTVPESSEIGYVLFISSADDPDSGENNGVSTYELVADDDTFSLQTPGIDGGNLGIVVNKNLDRETQKFYRFRVVAKDGGIPIRSGSVLINVTLLDTNDNSPIFEHLEYAVSFPENTPVGTTVLKVTANDKDIGENGEVLYRFSARASDKVKHIFNVNDISGEITLKKEIDYEKDQYFQFTVEAYDKGASSNKAQSIVIVTITDENDNSPEIHINISPGGSEILEPAEVDRYIAYVDAQDPDSGENGTVTCTINSDYFRLESINTGMYKVKLNKLLDRETVEVHNINIICSDNGKPKRSNTTMLSIRVLDINDKFPVFNQSNYDMNVHENNKIGDVIGMVTATDDDIGEHALLSYHIEHSFEEEYFRINQNTGLLSANSVFDREERAFYEFKVIAKDSGQIIHSSSATVRVRIVDKNDGTPKFTEDRYIFYVEEETQLGTEVGNVTVVDHDTGANGEVSFLQDFPYDGVFVIDSATGKITTKKLLDRETNASYIFDLTAQDKGNPPLQSTTKIEIFVKDTNDNVPLVNFPTNRNNTVSVPQKTTIGTIIARISATDLDEGVNAQLTYHIMQGDRRGIFRMNNLTGAMIVDKHIDESDAGTYTVLIAVQDNGIPQQTTWTNLILIIQDDNGRQNMIIAIAVATVTFALSVAMILTIFVIRRRDVMRKKQKELEVKSDKQNFVAGWLNCLSTSSKDIQKMNMGEKVKDTNKQMDYKTDTDMQLMVPDTGSTSSEDSKSIGPGSNQNLTKIDNNLNEKKEEMSPREQDSGFGESLERRGLQEMKGGFHDETQRSKTSYLDSRGVRIPSPYLDTSLPNRCWKKNDRQTYNRAISFDDEVLREREREKSNVSSFSSFNCRSISDSGQNPNLFTISEQKQPYGCHSLQRNPPNSNKSLNSKYSFRNPPRRDLPPISATPEPEVVEPCDYEPYSYGKKPYSLDRHSFSDNHINIHSDIHSQSPRSETYTQSPRPYSPRSDIYVQSSRSDTYVPHSGLDTYVESSRSDTYVNNSRLNTHANSHSRDGIILGKIDNNDIVV
ncbi:protocadherin delta 1 [Mytilus galloprovincialis]|uniref:Protocadherin-20 n=1 Tax=Mytilus galloprovincialis TaxID=29158 RepID=A0A8B6D5E2_MYTGA|nr:protocadherin delta 1 [Mytilus galloprovincialis]